MANQWFKFYGGEYLSDPKMLSLSAPDRSCFMTLLCYASMTNGVVEYLAEEQLLVQSGIVPNSDEWEKTKGILNKLERLKIITVSNGVISLVHWGKRQEYTMTATERSRKYRLKQKVKSENETTATKRNKKETLEQNRTEQNRTEKREKEPDTGSGVQIAELIKEFESVNPACKRFYGNTTQRTACEDLINTYSFDRVKMVIGQTLQKTNGMQFFPTIITPVQLRDKWVILESAIKKYQSENKTKGKGIA